MELILNMSSGSGVKATVVLETTSVQSARLTPLKSSYICSDPNCDSPHSSSIRSSANRSFRNKIKFDAVLDRLRGSPTLSNWSGSESVFCRICHESETLADVSDTEATRKRRNSLISPCQCSGSVGLIHRSCLEKWLSTVNKNVCEICGHQFDVTSKPKSFKEWVCVNHCGQNHRNLTADIICFSILTPLTVISSYLCGAGSSYYMKTEEQLLEAVGLILLASFLCLIYFIWIGLAVRFHIQSFREWQKHNQDVRLVEVVADPQTVESHL